MTLHHTKRLTFSALAATLTVATIEALSLLTITLSRPMFIEPIRTTGDIFREQSARIRRLLGPPGMLALDSLLGWRYRSSYHDAANTLNAQGLRAMRVYTTRPAPGVLRVAAFGDSFVYGNEVADSAAWPALVERWFPGLEVLNYGVGGYGVDQAYLRFCTEGAALSPQIVLIGFTTDDIRRVVNVYRRFLSNREYPLIKPRFLLDHRRLVYLPNPAPHSSDYERYQREPRAVTELGRYDYWYHPEIYQEPLYDLSATVRFFTNIWIRMSNRYLAPNRMFSAGELNTASEAFRIQMLLFERLAAGAWSMGARPIIVILPDRGSVLAARGGRRTVLATLDEALTARRLEYIDLTSAFAAASGDPEDWFAPGGHYSPAGNAIVARRLGPELLTRAREALPRPDHRAQPSPPAGCPAQTDLPRGQLGAAVLDGPGER